MPNLGSVPSSTSVLFDGTLVQTYLAFTTQISDTIRIYHECEVWIEKSVQRITV